MKYAVLGYDREGSLDTLAGADKRALHAGHQALQAEVQALADPSVRVIAHYRVRPSRHATTVRLAGDKVVRLEGPSAESCQALRALYLLESDEPDAVLDLAARLPAVRMGGTIEVWPLIEPSRRMGEHQEGEAASA
jgi:hypothetical protein